MKKVLFALVVLFAFIASLSSQTVVPVGHPTIYPNTWYDYSFLISPPSAVSFYQFDEIDNWGVSNGHTFDEHYLQNPSWGHAKLMVTGTGVGTLVVQIAAQGVPTIYGYLEITVIADPNAPPLTAHITGPSSVATYSTGTFYLDGGKDQYEWNLPFGTTSIQQNGNMKVVQFYMSGERTIKGRYKKDGAWSEWDTHEVNVY